MQIPIVLGRECRVAVIGRCTARKHRLAQFPRTGDDRGLSVAEAEGIGVENRRIERGVAGCGCTFADLSRHVAAACIVFRN